MKITFDLNLGRLAIEGDEPDIVKVLDAAKVIMPTINQIQIINTKEGKKQSDDESAVQQDKPAPRGNKTLREFARSLTVDNAAERIAAIAYYINKIEGRPSFSPKELDGWFTMCGFQKPQQMPVALFDTKRKYGYADNIGRGSWRISNQGENLIIRKIEESAEKGG